MCQEYSYILRSQYEYNKSTPANIGVNNFLKREEACVIVAKKLAKRLQKSVKLQKW